MSGLSVHLQHRDHLDRDRQVKIQPDVVVRWGTDVVAIADIKYKRPFGGPSNDDVYQAIAYATRYGLDRVTLIFAEPPPMVEINVGGISVALTSIDLSLPAPDRNAALASLAREIVRARS